MESSPRLGGLKLIRHDEGSMPSMDSLTHYGQYRGAGSFPIIDMCVPTPSLHAPTTNSIGVSCGSIFLDTTLANI